MHYNELSVPVYLYAGTVDMRQSFDKLSERIKSELKRSVISGGLYVFFSRCRSRVKILYWDKDGYCLWYKRLEAGSFKVESSNEYEEVEYIDLMSVLSGIEFSRIKLQKSSEKGLYT